MAYRGHWLYEDLRKIDTIAETTASKYWYALRNGVIGDIIDDDAMRETVMKDTQPTRVQRMLKTLLKERPDLRTPALTELIKEYIPDPEPVKQQRGVVLPTLDELGAKFAEVSAKPTKQNMAIWTVLRLALDGYPFRNSEFASIIVGSCPHTTDSVNFLDLDTGVLTLRKHKNDKRGARVYELPEFTREWVAMSMRVFGRVLPTLVTNKKGAPMKPNALGNFLSRQNVKLGSQTVRPAITTATLASGAGHDDRERLAHQMGHSRGVQMDKYFRGGFAPP